MNAYAAPYTVPRRRPQDHVLRAGQEQGQRQQQRRLLVPPERRQLRVARRRRDFTGTHTDGDVLVVSEFTNGGGVSNDQRLPVGRHDSCIDNRLSHDQRLRRAADRQRWRLQDSHHRRRHICATTNSGPLVERPLSPTKWLTSDATLGVGHTVVLARLLRGRDQPHRGVRAPGACAVVLQHLHRRHSLLGVSRPQPSSTSRAARSVGARRRSDDRR